MFECVKTNVNKLYFGVCFSYYVFLWCCFCFSLLIFAVVLCVANRDTPTQTRGHPPSLAIYTIEHHPYILDCQVVSLSGFCFDM